MNKSLSFLAVVSLGIILASCKPVSSSSYEGVTVRYATVCQDGDKVDLYYDPTMTEVAYHASLDNFKAAKDLDKFRLKAGDMGIAEISYYLVPDDGIYQYKLESFEVEDVDTLNFGEFKTDSITDYYQLSRTQLGLNTIYDFAWCSGHVLNAVVTFFPDPDKSIKQNDFQAYLNNVHGDTLSILIVGNIPDQNTKYDPEHRHMRYDLSTIMKSDSKRADDFMKQMLALHKDSLYLEVTSCDSIGITEGNQYRKFPKENYVTRFAFDFAK